MSFPVRLIKRMRVAGTMCPVGLVVNIPADRLRVAAHWVRCGAAVPVTPDCRQAIELLEAVRRLPVAAGTQTPAGLQVDP